MIKEEFKWLFKDLDKNEPICEFGLECGKGWYTLLNKLFEEIDYIDKLKCTRITQIKEKFGTLRVYYTYIEKPNDIVERLVHNSISIAEYNSKRICETCGKIGTLKQNDYHRVTCEVCEENYK